MSASSKTLEKLIYKQCLRANFHVKQLEIGHPEPETIRIEDKKSFQAYLVKHKIPKISICLEQTLSDILPVPVQFIEGVHAGFLQEFSDEGQPDKEHWPDLAVTVGEAARVILPGVVTVDEDIEASFNQVMRLCMLAGSSFGFILTPKKLTAVRIREGLLLKSRPTKSKLEAAIKHSRVETMPVPWSKNGDRSWVDLTIWSLAGLAGEDVQSRTSRPVTPIAGESPRRLAASDRTKTTVARVLIPTLMRENATADTHFAEEDLDSNQSIKRADQNVSLYEGRRDGIGAIGSTSPVSESARQALDTFLTWLAAETDIRWAALTAARDAFVCRHPSLETRLKVVQSSLNIRDGCVFRFNRAGGLESSGVESRLYLLSSEPGSQLHIAGHPANKDTTIDITADTPRVYISAPAMLLRGTPISPTS